MKKIFLMLVLVASCAANVNAQTFGLLNVFRTTGESIWFTIDGGITAIEIPVDVVPYGNGVRRGDYILQAREVMMNRFRYTSEDYGALFAGLEVASEMSKISRFAAAVKAQLGGMKKAKSSKQQKNSVSRNVVRRDSNNTTNTTVSTSTKRTEVFDSADGEF